MEDGASIPTGKLWPDDNPLHKAWDRTRARCARWSEPGSSYAFWRRWYDSLLDPQTHRPFPQDLLYQIALIPGETWDGGPEAVAQAIAEIEAEFAGAANPEHFELSPSQSLAKNARTIRLQLETLLSLINTEIDELRGRNSVPETARPGLEKRIEILTRLAERVETMAQEFEGGVASENALVAIAENLPAIPGEAAALEEAGGEPEISDLVVTMGASVQYLTKRGMPGHVASGVAAFDYLRRQFKEWRSIKKQGDPT